MSIKGNVVSCDACGRQVSMPMELGGGSKCSLDQRVRVYAVEEQGWRHTAQGDFCSDHIRTQRGA
jgi:hypothetical protein